VSVGCEWSACVTVEISMDALARIDLRLSRVSSLAFCLCLSSFLLPCSGTTKFSGMQTAKDLFSWGRGIISAGQNAASVAANSLRWEEPDSSETNPLDDGSINEKEIHVARKAKELSPILHASFGLDHYPNYLLRWDMASIEELEGRLEKQLELVRKQKETARRRLEATASFNQELSTMELDQFLDPRFLDCLKPGGGIRPSRLKNILEEECDGAFSFPLLRPDFCQRLLESAEKYQQGVEHQALESMDYAARERPLVLDLMKLDWLNDALLEHVINPIAQLVMEEEVGDEGGLDWRHGYIVSYAAPELQGNGTEFGKPPRSKLVAHSDDAEVTLNVCLGRDYSGGELVVYGRRGTDQELVPQTTIQPRKPGMALLHSGRQLHEVLPVEKGQRFGLIVWTRSLRGVRDGVCPCCWMNGRHPYPAHCICGPAWN